MIHTVQPDETIASIAESYGVDAEQLFAANRDALGSTPDNIAVGMALTIPEAAAGASAASADHLELEDPAAATAADDPGAASTEEEGSDGQTDA